MRIVIMILLVLAGFVKLNAQDFVSRFLDEHLPDSNLTCITISPKMMREIVRNDSGKSEELLEMIADLKSMQLLQSQVDGQRYYEAAIELIDKNNSRFEAFPAQAQPTVNSRMVVCRKRNEIIELVMLMNENEQFTVINFTGRMDEEFITKLAAILQSPIDDSSCDT